MTTQALTMNDLINRSYSEAEIRQLDAPVITTTTGVFNAQFGAKTFSQLNQTANSFGALPKYVWPQSGFRAVTARAAASGGGVAEAAALPDTIKPTFAEITVPLKEIAHNFEQSTRYEAVSNAGDDTIPWEELRELMSVHHAEMLNVMLHVDGDTLAGNNIESLDRVASSAAEATAFSWTTGDEDIHGIDRSAASWADAIVLHASGTDRVITDLLIRSLDQQTLAAGANKPGQMWITGYDTWNDITGLYQSQVTYNPIGNAYVAPSVNGIQVASPGVNFGVSVATLYDRPVICDKNVVKDTKSRLYLFDTSDPGGRGRPRLGIAVAKPTQYVESDSMFSINKFAKEGMYFTQCELVCTFFACQGKIRDLL